jgi:GR25 family glycosyltransferase involved in LPS biosynthesis
MDLKSLTDITNVFYINLEARPDRKAHIEAQLKTVGFPSFERFGAIKMPNGNGRIGCSMSHIKCLELAKERGYSHLMICEDDTLFLEPAIFKEQLNKFLEKRYNWDVVLFAGNNVPPYERIDDTCICVSRCQTTTCYMVNSKYFDILIANMKEGVAKLMQNPSDHFNYAIDKYWTSLQQKDNWYMITPLTVVQREDYSDIEQRITNYGKMMVDLDKAYLFHPVPNFAQSYGIQASVGPQTHVGPQKVYMHKMQ